MGITIHETHYQEFKQKILDFAQKRISDDDLIPTVNIDAEITLDDINPKLLEDLELVEPFGMGNAEPVFALYNQHPYDVTKTGNKGDHIKLKFRAGDNFISAIGWVLGHLYDDCSYPDCRIDVACNIERNFSSVNGSPILKMIDIKPSRIDELKSLE